MVDGLALGGQLIFGADAYKQYQCSESEQFPAFIWCQKQRQEPSRWGEVTLSNSILHTRDGQAVYINRYVEPAYFNPTGIRTQIESLSAKFGERPREFRIPPRDGLPKAVIAVWGRIQLDPLTAADVSLIASGGSPHKGFLVSFLGDLERSAKRGMPIYRLTGGPGFLWAATFNEQGRGVLRFLTIDPSRLPAPVQIATTKAGPTSVTPPPLPEQSAVPNAPIKERVSKQSLAKSQPTNSESPTVADSPAHCQNLAPEYITLDTRNQRVVLDGKSCDVLNDDRDATEFSLYCAGERRQVKLQTNKDYFFVGIRVWWSRSISLSLVFLHMLNGNERNLAGISPSWIENHKFLISAKTMAESYDAYMDVKACADGGFRVSNDAAIKSHMKLFDSAARDANLNTDELWTQALARADNNTVLKILRAAMMAAKLGAVDGLDTLAMRQGCAKSSLCCGLNILDEFRAVEQLQPVFDSSKTLRNLGNPVAIADETIEIFVG